MRENRYKFPKRNLWLLQPTDSDIENECVCKYFYIILFFVVSITDVQMEAKYIWTSYFLFDILRPFRQPFSA